MFATGDSLAAGGDKTHTTMLRAVYDIVGWNVCMRVPCMLRTRITTISMVD